MKHKKRTIKRIKIIAVIFIIFQLLLFSAFTAFNENTSYPQTAAGMENSGGGETTPSAPADPDSQAAQADKPKLDDSTESSHSEVSTDSPAPAEDTEPSPPADGSSEESSALSDESSSLAAEGDTPFLAAGQITIDGIVYWCYDNGEAAIRNASKATGSFVVPKEITGVGGGIYQVTRIETYNNGTRDKGAFEGSAIKSLSFEEGSTLYYNCRLRLQRLLRPQRNAHHPPGHHHLCGNQRLCHVCRHFGTR